MTADAELREKIIEFMDDLRCHCDTVSDETFGRVADKIINEALRDELPATAAPEKQKQLAVKIIEEMAIERGFLTGRIAELERALRDELPVAAKRELRIAELERALADAQEHIGQLQSLLRGVVREME